MTDILEFFRELFSSDAFMPRWKCGKWSEFHGWMYVLADITIFLAYMAIPVAIYYFIRKKFGSLPFTWLLWLFIAFIALCGTTHLIDALIFWIPVYRLNALMMFATAIVSVATVLGMLKVIPLALEFKSPEELLKSESKFKSLLESAPDAMIIVDKAGIINLVNAQAVKIFGHEREELIGQPVNTLIPDRFHEVHPGHRKGFHDNPKARPMGAGRELWGKRKDGSEFPIEISLSPLTTQDETLVSAAIRDITERKIAQDELVRAKELSAKSGELERFAHITAHNIRSPAANLSSLTKLLKKEEDPEEQKQITELLDQSVEVLMRTLDDVSEVLTATNNKIKSQVVAFDETLHDVKTELREQIAESGTELKVDFSDAPEVIYPVDHVHNIMINLVSNAIRYRHPDRKNVIELTTKLEEGHVMLTVKDNGLGVDLGKHGDKIFQLYKTFHDNPESRGVGLFLIKNQLKSLDGDVHVQSTVNRGTEFIVKFGKQSI